jgi:hypothetical protein
VLSVYGFSGQDEPYACTGDNGVLDASLSRRIVLSALRLRLKMWRVDCPVPPAANRTREVRVDVEIQRGKRHPCVMRRVGRALTSPLGRVEGDPLGAGGFFGFFCKGESLLAWASSNEVALTVAVVFGRLGVMVTVVSAFLLPRTVILTMSVSTTG